MQSRAQQKLEGALAPGVGIGPARPASRPQAGAVSLRVVTLVAAIACFVAFLAAAAGWWHTGHPDVPLALGLIFFAASFLPITP